LRSYVGLPPARLLRSEERARFLRRIKSIVEQGYLGAAWSKRIEGEIADIGSAERSWFTARAANWAEKAAEDVLGQYVHALGIDLGTSNTVVALYQKDVGQPEIVELEGMRLIPSILAIDEAGQEVVGVPVAAWLASRPKPSLPKRNARWEAGSHTRLAGMCTNRRRFRREFSNVHSSEVLNTSAEKSARGSPPLRAAKLARECQRTGLRITWGSTHPQRSLTRRWSRSRLTSMKLKSRLLGLLRKSLVLSCFG
jgi:hypothetical protein